MIPMLLQSDTQLNDLALQSVLKNLNIGILILQDSLTIIKADGPLFDTLEIDKEQCIDQSFFSLFPEINKQTIQKKLLAKNLTASIATPKFRKQLRDGSSLYLRLYFERILPSSELIAICDEVTEERELEEALRRSYEELHLLNAKMDHTSARLSRLLERFMPARVAKKIIHEEEIPFPGSNQVRECSILFTDMRNFTAFAEQATPKETVNVLNKYFDVISTSIDQYEGSIVQLIGDLLMATFNVPDDQPDHAYRACLAAVEIKENLNKLKRRAGEDLPYLGFGIGIGTGLVTPSYIGSKNRFQFAAVGDVTNVAYHLCSKARADQIIIAHSTLKSAETYSTFVQAEHLGELQLKRRKQPLQAYELVDIA